VAGRAVPARRKPAAPARAVQAPAPTARIEVRKTYKLYIGGAFPRTESGRSYLVAAADGTPVANACRGSRKDLRDAVRAARKAFPGWADRTAMNRGQVLYRVAELMEGRRDQFVAEVAAAEGLREPKAREVVDRAIDRWVWYAGWADKIAQVLGSSNPVAADYFNFTIPEPTGVVGIVAPETSSLLGLVSRLAPPLVAGNAVVVLASEARPLPAITLTEVLATSDVPGGVVNVITGLRKELVPVLAGHVDVDTIDVWGVEESARRDTELLATDNVKRIVRRPAGVSDARFDWLDDRAAERPEWIAAYLEMKTVWHPIGV
jgi:acyl-CoA reductase-like NAD-dependent aldehyde dehydrogenase